MEDALPRLDPADLRAYARRDWGVVEQESLRDRVSRPADEKVAVAIALYEAAKRTRPGWPNDDDRRADLEHHVAMRRLLDRARHVGAR